MKTPVLFVAVAWAAVWLLPSVGSYGADHGISSHPADCDNVAKRVIAEIKKDPQKVLMVVEDFMVSNPNCAAEIVKAAVTSTKGPADLKKQIAITATHVDPEMAKAIADAIASVAPEEATEIQVATQKEAGSQTPTVAQNQTSEVETTPDTGSGDDYKLPLDLRSVFFIEPISAGSALAINIGANASGSGSSNKSSTKTTTRIVVQNNTVSTPRPNRPSPVSPSSGSP
jgi:hypothetical protein